MFDPHAGATYSFEHMSLASAEERAQAAEVPHIVETINWTKSVGGDVHYNRYFAHALDEALGRWQKNLEKSGLIQQLNQRKSGWELRTR